MMDELLDAFPPILVDKRTGQRCWFTIGATNTGWDAAYIDADGAVTNSLVGHGPSPVAAMEDLLQFIRLAELGNNPPVHVNEATGEITD